MISQAGGGVAFYKSPQIWRINHYRFFHLPMDRSGFYTYIRDGEEVWCPTCEPCPVKPEKWKGFHGMGYTGFQAEHRGLEVHTTYLVGKEEDVLIWDMTLRSDRDRKVRIFPYVELGMMEFLREVQWQCYNKHQLACYPLGDILVYRYEVENQPRPEETPLVFFALPSLMSTGPTWQKESRARLLWEAIGVRKIPLGWSGGNCPVLFCTAGIPALPCSLTWN